MSRDAIDRGHEQFLDAMRAGDAAALLAVLTDDVTFYPPHEPARAGKRAVEDRARQVFSAISTEHVSISDRKATVAGDWAFEIGSFVWATAPATGGAITEQRRHFIGVWQRQADGTWRVAHDLWNSSVPA